MNDIIIFDEVTQFTRQQHRYLQTRLTLSEALEEYMLSKERARRSHATRQQGWHVARLQTMVRHEVFHQLTKGWAHATLVRENLR